MRPGFGRFWRFMVNFLAPISSKFGLESKVPELKLWKRAECRHQKIWGSKTKQNKTKKLKADYGRQEKVQIVQQHLKRKKLLQRLNKKLGKRNGLWCWREKQLTCCTAASKIQVEPIRGQEVRRQRKGLQNKTGKKTLYCRNRGCTGFTNVNKMTKCLI